MSKSSRRFTSEKTAQDFVENVKGEIKDIRNHPEAKSNFKVVYDKQDAKDWGGKDEY